MSTTAFIMGVRETPVTPCAYNIDRMGQITGDRLTLRFFCPDTAVRRVPRQARHYFGCRCGVRDPHLGFMNEESR